VRHSVTILAAEPTEDDDWLRALARRTDLGHDDAGRSAEPAPAPAKPTGPPQGARDPGTVAPSADAFVRAALDAARTGVPPDGRWMAG
jgi:hypothetical protein